uniref:Transporter n=1 Tax=Fasciola hepatica TaxID=6192 RepID=A0A2R4LGM2_FASHE|nr:sodium- and chloride-dependent taurine transporter [Fasciola hepatica]
MRQEFSFPSKSRTELAATSSIHPVFEVKDECSIIPVSSSLANKKEVEKSPREQWKRRFDFLLSLVGLSVGLGNIWRFPYLCYKHGGGAFLIPYFISIFAAGLPVFLLEVTVGQITAQGGIAAWNICPLFRGIGFASLVTNFCLDCYYNVILAWALYYLFSSFTSTLPWTLCGQWWNTPQCDNGSGLINGTVATDPAAEFWENRVLGLSKGIEHLGPVRWDLALCLLLAWIIVFLCIFKGIKTSGKVMYVTATSPYIFMFILLVRAATLEGAIDGIRYYMVPDWSKLADVQMWADAGAQIFFSYSISLGTLTALGSYNSFHQNSFRDCLAYATVNTLTSLLAGFIIFATLGHMALKADLSIDQVAESGPGLAFVIYPKAIGMMKASPFWSVCFFLMLLLLGIDSQFAGVEGFITSITDFYPRLVLRPKLRILFVGSVCLACFLVGLTMVTEGGMYLFQLFNHYAGSRIILLTAFFECIAAGYDDGAKRIGGHMKKMHGWGLGVLPQVFWCVISPVFTLGLFIVSVVVHEEVSYERASRTEVYHFPQWSIIFGWLLAACSVIMIPIIMVFELLRTPGTFSQRLRTLSHHKLTGSQLMRLQGRKTENDSSASTDSSNSRRSKNGLTNVETQTKVVAKRFLNEESTSNNLN